MLKRSWATNQWTCRANTGTSNAGAESVGVSDCNKMKDVLEDQVCSVIASRLQRISESWVVVGPSNESMEVNSESNPLKRKDAEGPSLDEKEDVRGVESDLVDSFEEGEIRDDSVLYNDGCIKDCMEKNLEDDAGEILGVHSQDSIIAPPSTPRVMNLIFAAESGSLVDRLYCSLTSDEIDSDKRWSYRDPNGNIHGLFSLAQLRSWKDYFPSDLQIWSYYDNVKEAILLHNALSRQTKDAG
ncbi:zinc finger CCCH domain-containing protein 19 [Tanacetum coccineum]